MLFRTLLVWILLLCVAVGNGTVRVALIIPHCGEYAGHLLSTVIACILFLFITWLFIPWIAPQNRRELSMVGLLWVFLTVCFEFLAGHYILHAPWSVLLADYDIVQGRIWVLVLLTLFFAPRWAAKSRGLAK